MTSKLQNLITLLEDKISNKLEVREIPFASEYTSRERNFGGVATYKVDGEEFMIAIERVPSKGVTLLDFTVDNVDYFARSTVETEAEKEVRVKEENRQSFVAKDEIYEIRASKDFTFDSYVIVSKDKYCPLKQGDPVRITTNFTSLNFDGGVVQHVKESGNSDLYLIVEADKYFENYEDYLADKEIRDIAEREARRQALIQQKIDEAEADRRKELERAEKAEAGRLKAIEYGAAELSGTPKQVEWANQLRSNYIDLMIYKKREDDLKLVFATTKFNTSKFWIDNKSSVINAVEKKLDFEKLRKQHAKKLATANA